MHARQLSEINATPIQLSLRIRHPAIDPREISDALELEPEHCFRAGDPRTAATESGRLGQHTQSYWLASLSVEPWLSPSEPALLDPAAAKNLKVWGIEGVLLYFVRRLNMHHSFLQRIQSEGGDISLLLGLERDSASDFTLPVSLARLLAQSGISIEFKFDS